MIKRSKSIFLGIGKSLYMIIIICALISISCADTDTKESENNNSGEGSFNPPDPLSEAMSLACNDNQLDKLTDLLSWNNWNRSEITEVKCIYITPAGTDGENGIDWDNAFSVDKLRDLASDSFEKPAIDQVFLYLLKAGTYTPTIASGGRDKSFSMQNYVAIIGGFSGMGFERSGTTILSGDIDGDNDNAGNSYHVINNNFNGLFHSALLAHVTVSHGNANGSSQDDSAGGGLRNKYSSPTVTAVTFSDNVADLGGGMYNSNSRTTVTASTFSGNTATGSGGGSYDTFSTTTFIASTFSGNTATIGGGGIFIAGRSSLTFVASTFYRNEANYKGGAVYINHNGYGVVTMVNSLLWSNYDNSNTTPNQVYLHTDGHGDEVLIMRHSVLQGGVDTGGVTNDTGNDAERSVFYESLEGGDPGLEELANNGGPVWTHAFSGGFSAENTGVKTGWDTDKKLCFFDRSVWLRADTRAHTVDIDEATTCNGDITEITTDARGYTHNGLPDIGAFELNGTPPEDSP